MTGSSRGLNRDSDKENGLKPLRLAVAVITAPFFFGCATDNWVQLNGAAERAYQQRNYAEAESAAVAALREVEDLATQERRMAISLFRLGEIYQAQSRNAEAERFLKRALDVYEQTSALEHPEYSAVLNSLAKLYYVQGRYAEAEPLYRQGLIIFGKIKGAESLAVATSLKSLAMLYQDQGRLIESELLYKRSVAIYEKVLGPDHPDVASTLENYSALLRKMDREAEAGKLETRASGIKAKRPKK